MTTPIASVDNTTLLNLTTNLDADDVADPALRLVYFQYLNVYIQSITSAFNAFVANGAVETGNLADLSITTAKLADLAVQTGKIADLAIVTAKINDLAVTIAKMAANSVGSTQLVDLSVTTEKLNDLSVTAAKIANGTITLSKLDLTSLDSRYYTETEMDTSLALKANSADVYTRAELTPYLQGGETSIKYEVYTIVNSNNGDGTFTYKDVNNVNIVGTLTVEGYQTFTLQSGVYAIGLNRVEMTINDTLQRSVASGGLAELTTTTIALTVPEGAGAEITIKFYERIGLTGEASVIIGSVTPIATTANMVWFKLL